MADADTIINVTKSDFSQKSAPNDSSLKDFQFAIKKVSGEQKNFLESLYNTLNDFFKNEKFKPTSEKQLADVANRLYNNLVKNLKTFSSSLSSDSSPQTSENVDLSTIDVGDLSKLVISDSPKKANLEQYLKEQLASIKEDSGTNEKIDNVTFTEKELESFKKNVIEKIKEIVSEETKRYNVEAKKEVPETDVASLWNESEFYKRHKDEIEKMICLPVIDFLNIETKVVNGLKEKIEKIKETVSNSKVKKNGTTPLLIRGTSITNIFKNKKKDLPLSFAETFSRVNKFWLKHPLRQVKRTIRDWGKKLAKNVAHTLDYFLPITELLFIGGIVSKIVKFSFSLAKGITFVLSNAWKFLRSLFKNTIGRLFSVFKKLKESSFTKVTVKIFKDFFQSYIGAYLLGYAVGFFYKVFKGFLPGIKERWHKFLEYIKPVLETIKGIEEKIVKFASAAWFSIDDVAKELSYYIKTHEDKSVLDALEFLSENTRDSEGRLIQKNGQLDIFGKISAACDWIQNNFTIRNLGKLGDTFKNSVANMALDWLGSMAGAAIGAAIGGALLGPFGVVAGGVIGSFVGSGVRRFLYGEEKKLTSQENVYDKYLRTKYGRVNPYSSAERMLQTDTGEYDTTKDFGFVLDIMSRNRRAMENAEKLELSDAELQRLEQLKASKKISFTQDENGYIVDFPEEFEYLSNLNDENIENEINSAMSSIRLLNEKGHWLRREGAAFNHRDFASTEDSDKARLSLIALNGENEHQFPKSANNFTDRAVLLHRIYRAVALRNMLDRILLNEITPKEFMDTYKLLNRVTPENRNQENINNSIQIFVHDNRIDVPDEIIDDLNRMSDTSDSMMSKLPMFEFRAIDKFWNIRRQNKNRDNFIQNYQNSNEQTMLQFKQNDLLRRSQIAASRMPELQIDNTFAEKTLGESKEVESLVDDISESIVKIDFDPSVTIAVMNRRNQPQQQTFLTGPLADSGQVQYAI